GQRILEVHLTSTGHELVVIASHWTSRITDKDGAARGRYADQIYGAYRNMLRRDPNVNLLVCGDFNDTPDDASVTKHLHATADRAATLKSNDPPVLFNLLGHCDPRRFGTLYHRELLIFDQVVVSPALIGAGPWTCEPDSLQVIHTNHRQ